MPRQKPERKPLTARQRDRLVAELRAMIVRIERRRDRVARLASIYREALARMPHPGD